MDDSGPGDGDADGPDGADGGDGPDGPSGDPGSWVPTEETVTVVEPGPITESGEYEIEAPELFGGEEAEGGVQGKMWVMMGESTQVPVDKLVEVHAESGIAVPGYRGVTTIVFDGRVTGRNPYPKPWKFRVRRWDKGWDMEVPAPENALILLGNTEPDAKDYEKIKAMNPAHIIYECATNRAWGRGLDPIFIDTDSFVDASEVLFNENFGLCLRWARQDSLDSFVQTVLDHIGGATYIDRQTGKLTLKLIRNDYDPEDLKLWNFDNGLVAVNEEQGSGASGLVNEVVVAYKDPIRNLRRQFRVQNIATMQALGGIFSETKEYPGIPTPELAARVAQRDLRALGLPIKKFKVVTDRRGWTIAPFSVIKIQDPSRGIASLILRVGAIEDGDDGNITLTCLQDIFGFPVSSYTVPQPGGNVPPISGPVAPTTQRAFEVSYRDYYVWQMGNVSALLPEGGHGALVVQRPTVLALSFAMFSKETAGDGVYVERQVQQFTPTGTLTATVTTGANTFTLAGMTEWSRLQVNTPVLVDSEICRLNSWDATAGTISVSRGCVDTVPTPHNAGARVWIYHNAVAVDNTQYTRDDAISMRACTRTASGQLDVSLAPTATLTFKGRPTRPYPPGDVKVNTVRFDLSYSWEAQAGVFDWSIEGISPTRYTTGLLAQAAALAQYNIDNGGGWSVATGFPTMSGADYLETQFVKDEGGPGEEFSLEFAFTKSPHYEPVNLTWAHRNRITQADQLIPHEFASISPEVGQAYTVRIMDGTTIVQEFTGITGETFTYTDEDWRGDGELATFGMVLFSTRDGESSMQGYKLTVNRP